LVVSEGTQHWPGTDHAGRTLGVSSASGATSRPGCSVVLCDGPTVSPSLRSGEAAVAPADGAAVKVLVVGADHQTADTARRALMRAAFAVQVVGCPNDAIVWIDKLWPDLVVIDVGDERGRGLFRTVRQRGAVPVIMISPSADADDRAWGLDLGADDFVPVPMSPSELVARTRSVLRRHPPAPRARANDLLTAGPVVLDRQTRRVRVLERWVALTTKEFALLDFLVCHPGETFHRDVLLERVWGYTFGDASTVVVHVRRLREKVEPDPSHPVLVVTVWGAGYCFDPSGGRGVGAPSS